MADRVDTEPKQSIDIGTNEPSKAVTYSVRYVEGQRWQENWARQARDNSCSHPVETPRSAPHITLLAYRDDLMIGFIECVEFDEFTVGWRFAGVFKDVQKTLAVVPCAILLLDFCHARYFRIRTYIGKSDETALRFAKFLGFQQTGVRSEGAATVIEMECQRPGLSLSKVQMDSFSLSSYQA